MQDERANLTLQGNIKLRDDRDKRNMDANHTYDYNISTTFNITEVNSHGDGSDIYGCHSNGTGCYGHNDDYHHSHSTLEEVAHIFHLSSLSIISVFVLEVFLKLFGMGFSFFRKKMEIFDAIIIIASFTIDLVLMYGAGGTKGEDASALLIVFLLWRVLRVINGLMVTIKQRIEFRIKLQKRARRRAERKLELYDAERDLTNREINALKEICYNYGAQQFEVDACKPTPKFAKRLDTSGLSGLSLSLSMSMSMGIFGMGRRASTAPSAPSSVPPSRRQSLSPSVDSSYSRGRPRTPSSERNMDSKSDPTTPNGPIVTPSTAKQRTMLKLLHRNRSAQSITSFIESRKSVKSDGYESDSMRNAMPSLEEENENGMQSRKQSMKKRRSVKRKADERIGQSTDSSSDESSSNSSVCYVNMDKVKSSPVEFDLVESGYFSLNNNESDKGEKSETRKPSTENVPTTADIEIDVPKDKTTFNVVQNKHQDTKNDHKHQNQILFTPRERPKLRIDITKANKGRLNIPKQIPTRSLQNVNHVAKSPNHLSVQDIPALSNSCNSLIKLNNLFRNKNNKDKIMEEHSRAQLTINVPPLSNSCNSLAFKLNQNHCTKTLEATNHLDVNNKQHLSNSCGTLIQLNNTVKDNDIQSNRHNLEATPLLTNRQPEEESPVCDVIIKQPNSKQVMATIVTIDDM
ncbi:unnamed protein product [Owenia fusiformis]|uniref:Voltage-gated hydrogen channel 1 n=1 Tax=Owenia fusiformis TaxID=6347 RepID=A0A8S4NZW8_OWEFU|nr:unnamed protein product [Owenia fusiformis]